MQSHSGFRTERPTLQSTDGGEVTAKGTKKTAGHAPAFEEALKRLEAIVARLESGAASLDETMGLYAEGIELSKTCLDRLTQAELQLKRLSKDANGKFELLDEPTDA